VETAWRLGARFDSWDDQMRWSLWTEALQRHADVPLDLFLGTLPVDARLPWDHLDMKLEPRFLATEYKRSMRSKLSPPCGKPVGAQVHHTNLAEHEADERILVCYHCGVECDMTRMREERGEFLEKLKAFRPPREGADVPAAAETSDGDRAAAEPLEILAAETVELTAGDRPGNDHRSHGHRTSVAPHDFHQGEPRRYRVRFAKRDVAALTGHLDLVRALPRVMRRAGIAPYYSQGFHPKPVMEFSPPLPLGVTSLDEVVDLSLAQDLPAADLLARLRTHAPSGMEFLAVERLEAGEAKLSRVLEAADYVVRVEAGELAAAPALAGGTTPEAALESFLGRETCPRVVTRKRAAKTVDIRPAVLEARWLRPEELPDLPDFTRPEARYLAVRVGLRSDAHARPEEVAAAVLGLDATPDTPQIARTRLVLREARAPQPATA